jgi:hypothetical protein
MAAISIRLGHNRRTRSQRSRVSSALSKLIASRSKHHEGTHSYESTAAASAIWRPVGRSFNCVCRSPPRPSTLGVWDPINIAGLNICGKPSKAAELRAQNARLEQTIANSSNFIRLCTQRNKCAACIWRAELEFGGASLRINICGCDIDAVIMFRPICTHLLCMKQRSWVLKYVSTFVPRVKMFLYELRFSKSCPFNDGNLGLRALHVSVSHLLGGYDADLNPWLLGQPQTKAKGGQDYMQSRDTSRSSLLGQVALVQSLC